MNYFKKLNHRYKNIFDNEINITTANNTYVTSNQPSIDLCTSKSIYKISCQLKKELKEIYNINQNIFTSIDSIKNVHLGSNNLLNELLHKSYSIDSYTSNITKHLENIHSNCTIFEDILNNLTDLSTITTHITNKTKIERSKEPINPEIINILIYEFHKYSSGIRDCILKLKSLLLFFQKDYYSCQKNINMSLNSIASNKIIISNLKRNINYINYNLNNINAANTKVKTILNISTLKNKLLIADSHKLDVLINNYANTSYSLSKQKALL